MENTVQMGTRRFGRVNWLGMMTLVEREVRRFMAVWSQTVLAPLINALLLLAVFSLAIGSRRGDVMGVPFMQFLVPGILMMTVIQNAFANSSSSILVAKIQGNIVDTLMPPLSAFEMLVGYLTGAVARGLFVAVPVIALMVLFLGTGIAHPLWLILFLVLGAVLMGGLGIIGAIYAEKFDQLSVITNFVITPLTFLSGTFYSIEVLPPVMQLLSHINPFFYLIDGTRFAVLGVSDSSPWIGLGVCGVTAALIAGLCWRWFRAGYRLKP